MAARNLYLRPVLKMKTYEPPELDMVSFVEIHNKYADRLYETVCWVLTTVSKSKGSRTGKVIEFAFQNMS